MEDLLKTTRKIRANLTKLLSKNTNHTCLYPNCSSNAISSHAISKSILKNIEVDGHVIGPVFDRCAIGKDLEEWTTPTSSNLNIKRIGLKDASTFKGFCKDHDNSVFSSLDDSGIVTYRDLFLQLYRTACRYYFVDDQHTQSELNHQEYEYNSNTEFEQKMLLNLPNLVLFFNDLLTDFDELKAPINLSFTETLCQKPYSQAMPLDLEIIYKKSAIRYPVALQKDFTLYFEGNYHHCQIILLPHADYTSLIIACHPSVVPKFGNFIYNGEIGLLRLIESIMMTDSEFYMDPSIYEKWSDKKRDIISDDFYYHNERKFLSEYDVSIFDDIRSSLLDELSDAEKKVELKKLKSLPARPSFAERDHQMTCFHIQQRHRKLKFTGNQTGRSYPIGAVRIDEQEGNTQSAGGVR